MIDQEHSQNLHFEQNIDLLNDSNWTRTQSYLVRKRTLNHLAKLASTGSLATGGVL